METIDKDCQWDRVHKLSTEMRLLTFLLLLLLLFCVMNGGPRQCRSNAKVFCQLHKVQLHAGQHERSRQERSRLPERCSQSGAGHRVPSKDLWSPETGSAAGRCLPLPCRCHAQVQGHVP